MHMTWRSGWLFVFSESHVQTLATEFCSLEKHFTLTVPLFTQVLEKWRKMFFVLSRAWDKVKILSPHKESNLKPSDFVLRCSTTEPQRLYGDRGLLRTEVHMTRVLHTAMISNVVSVMFWNNSTGIVSCRNGTFGF